MSWRESAVVAVLVMIVAVPTVALTADKPARFGFQMYSGYGAGSIEIRDGRGTAIDVDITSLLPRTLRPELDWTQYLPQHLCSQVPNAATVVIEREHTGRVSVSCD